MKVLFGAFIFFISSVDSVTMIGSWSDPKNYNGKIVFSEVYTFLVLQCKVNTRRMSKTDMGSKFHIKKSMKYSGHRQQQLTFLTLLNWSDPRVVMSSPGTSWKKRCYS